MQINCSAGMEKNVHYCHFYRATKNVYIKLLFGFFSNSRQFHWSIISNIVEYGGVQQRTLCIHYHSGETRTREKSSHRLWKHSTEKGNETNEGKKMNKKLLDIK